MNPIPFKYRLNGYAGCYEDRPDFRDYRYSELCGSPPVEMPSWESGFDVEKKYGALKVENQFSSLSCVSQACSYYAQMLNLIETGKFTDLSARAIYSNIYLPNGGAYIRSGIQFIVDRGTPEEKLAPSYNANGNTDEQFMRDKSWESKEVYDNAKIYKSKSYATISYSDPNFLELCRQAIYVSHGFVSGFNGHCLYFNSYGIKDGKKYLGYINSWGSGWNGNGHGYLFEDQLNQLYSVWTLVDEPNQPLPPNNSMMELVKKANSEKIFAVGGGKFFWIMNADSLNRGINSIWSGWESIRIDDDVDIKNVFGGAIFIPETDNPTK